ncbi:MAG: hypothetical protein EXS42_01955 [Lacunisphaera sp.]|nr:hypothetical protein [Lacunisphaera sp.]
MKSFPGQLILFSISLSFAFTALAQQKMGPPPPNYPKINTSLSYAVDPNWPQKPADFTWAAVPGVAVDKDDNVFLFTRSTPAVQAYSSDGKYLFGWGGGIGAHHIKIDREGHVWTTDFKQHIVQKHTRDGTVLMTLGIPNEAAEDATHFYMPTDVAFASNGDILVSDGYGNARIVRLSGKGKFIKAWGSMGTKPGELSIPHAIAIDSKDRVYVADRNNSRVQVYDLDGKLLDSWKDICIPWGFWMTDKDEIWLCGSTSMIWQDRDPKYPTAPLGCPPKDQMIMKFNTDGKLLQLWTFPKGADGQEKSGELNWVHCIAVDSKGSVYLGDIVGKRLQKFVLKQPN